MMGRVSKGMHTSSTIRRVAAALKKKASTLEVIAIEMDADGIKEMEVYSESAMQRAMSLLDNWIAKLTEAQTQMLITARCYTGSGLIMDTRIDEEFVEKTVQGIPVKRVRKKKG